MPCGWQPLATTTGLVTSVVVWRQHVHHLIGADIPGNVDGSVLNPVELDAATQTSHDMPGQRDVTARGPPSVFLSRCALIWRDVQ